MPRFKGIPIDEDEVVVKPRFGGIPVEEDTPESTGATRSWEDNAPYEKAGTLGALFPATLKQKQEGGNRAERAIATAGDAMSMLPRGVSAAATGIGSLAGGRNLSDSYDSAMVELGKTKSDETGALGVAQNVALDPTTWIPGGAAVKSAKILPSLGKTALRGAGEAAGAAAYQQASTGNVDAGRTAVQGLVGAGLGAGTAGLGSALGKGLGKTLTRGALKNVDIALKPGHTGKKLGFVEENVLKHNLGINPEEVFNNASDKLNLLQDRAKEIAATSTEKFDVEEIFDAVIKNIDRKKNPNNFSKQVSELELAKNNFVDAFGKEVDASDAMAIRSRIGDETAFAGRTSAGAKVDPDANWKEDIYNQLYHEWKTTLHNKLGGELKEINTAQSELIPIKAVADKRNTISKQNNRVSLADIGTMGTGAVLSGGGSVLAGDDRQSGIVKGLAVGAALAGGRRAMGSKVATQLAYKLGNKLAPEVAGKTTVKPALMWGSEGTGFNLGKRFPPDRLALPAPMIDNAAAKQKLSPNIDTEGKILSFTGAEPTKGNKMRNIGENIESSPNLPQIAPDLTYDELIANQAKKLRITPDRIETLLSNQDALETAIRNHEITYKGIAEAGKEVDDYINNLKKAPVISRSRLEFLQSVPQQKKPIGPIKSPPNIRGSGAVPILAGTAAGGIGALTAYEAFKNRKKK